MKNCIKETSSQSRSYNHNHQNQIKSSNHLQPPSPEFLKQPSPEQYLKPFTLSNDNIMFTLRIMCYAVGVSAHGYLTNLCWP